MTDEEKQGLERTYLTGLVLKDVSDERDRQDAKWGVQDHPPYKWLAIIMEELGEAAEAALDMEHPGGAQHEQRYREELTHVAATAVAAIEALERLEAERKHLRLEIGEPRGSEHA
jgi:hypothetical protein